MKNVGVGTRVLNFLVDTILVFFLSYGLYKWYVFYVMYWGYKYFPYYMFFFATLFAYYFLFEMIFSRTPGKWLSLTRVRSAAGGKPNVFQVFVRSLVRFTIIDFVFIGFIDRPLHDALSKTRVVEIE